MCGGVGSRLKPLTENMPKPLIKLLNRPILDFVIEKLINIGVTDISISLGFMANEIIEFCENKNYKAELKYYIETKPLGTAGGVKNCIKKSQEDVLILSGDNIFDIDLEKLIDFHTDCNADITVCAAYCTDPREYGVIIKDDDNSIVSFIEKPTWEQSESFLVNTGIYILKGEILDLIPENRIYDFSNDLFPEIFKSDKNFLCYESNAYWGDMGEFPAYRKITEDILSDKVNNFKGIGTYYHNDSVSEYGGRIIAPCIIGDDTKILKDAEVGPFTVLGNNCTIEENSVIKNSCIGNMSKISSDCELQSCIIDDNVTIESNCSIEENSVIAFGCKIGRFTRIVKNCKIWPGRRIEAQSFITKDVFYASPEKIQVDIFGISGKINSQITPEDTVRLGQALASVNGINKIGFGADSNKASEVYKDFLINGARTCSATCYDFGEMFKNQAYFYSAYCSLDAFIFASTESDIINFSFFGKNGIPFSSSQSRSINNNYRFSSFNFADSDKFNDVFNMKLFSTVYKSYFKKIIGDKNNKINFIIETENPLIKDILSILENKNKTDTKSIIQILIKSNGSEFYIIENEKFYSSERILKLLCEIQMAEGHCILIPEDAPSSIEDMADKYSTEVTRLYENDISSYNIDSEDFLKNIYFFDPVLMCAKLINIITSTNISLDELFTCQNEFALKKSIIEFDFSPSDLRKIFSDAGGVKTKEDRYYSFNFQKGRAKIRQLGNSCRARLLTEAYDMETAKEISGIVTQKIKNANIDKR